jgi:soluble lytic murein transglycosylase-like protein
LFGSKTPVGAYKRLVALASGALVALAPAAACAAEIFTLVQPDGSLLITDQPPFRLPPAIPMAAVVGGEHTIDTIARRHGLDPLLVRAVIRAESNFDARAVSPKGAAGLMQLMPETAQRYGVDNRFDPRQNVDGGVRYLRDLMAMFDGDLSLALAAYNAGEGAVLKYGRRIPPYPESRLYVVRVRSFYEELRRTGSAIRPR